MFADGFDESTVVELVDVFQGRIDQSVESVGDSNDNALAKPKIRSTKSARFRSFQPAWAARRSGFRELRRFLWLVLCRLVVVLFGEGREWV